MRHLHHDYPFGGHHLFEFMGHRLIAMRQSKTFSLSACAFSTGRVTVNSCARFDSPAKDPARSSRSSQTSLQSPCRFHPGGREPRMQWATGDERGTIMTLWAGGWATVAMTSATVIGTETCAGRLKLPEGPILSGFGCTLSFSFPSHFFAAKGI